MRCRASIGGVAALTCCELRGPWSQECSILFNIVLHGPVILVRKSLFRVSPGEIGPYCANVASVARWTSAQGSAYVRHLLKYFFCGRSGSFSNSPCNMTMATTTFVYSPLPANDESNLGFTNLCARGFVRGVETELCMFSLLHRCGHMLML
jgi:hypothetical protein